MRSYAIICDKWIAVWTFLWICGSQKRPSPVRCDQSAAAIAVVQAHRSRSPRSAGCSKPTQPSSQRKDWVNGFCIAFAKRWISMLFSSNHVVICCNWYISWYLFLVMRKQNCHSAEVKDELSHISGSNYLVQLIPVAIWTRLMDVVFASYLPERAPLDMHRLLRLDSCAGLLFFVVCKKRASVTNDKKIRTMYQCRVWSLMILWSALVLFSWCVDRVWWVWWELLGFGWLLTGDGLLIVWCLHALGYCMYCTYHYLLNFV